MTGVIIHYYIKAYLGSSKVIGVTCSASSYVRKQVVLDRIKKEIEDKKYPLEMEDFPNLNLFKITFKQ